MNREECPRRSQTSMKAWARDRASFDMTGHDDAEADTAQEEKDLADVGRLKGDARDIIVTLMNSQEIAVHCPKGHQTNAVDLKRLTLEHLGVEDTYHSLFSIWVMSPSLRLPAKDEHYPIKMLKLWPDLLAAYTESADPEEFPAIYLRKAPLTHPGVEVTVSDENAILLLFIELTDEVVNSECAVDEDDAVAMAATHLFLNFGEEATRKDVSESQGSQQPQHFAGKLRWKSWERRVFESLEEQLPVFQQQSPAEIMSDYLERGRQYATYGGVKFLGNVEPAEKGTLLQEQRTKEVLLSINFDGLHVTDTKTNQVILSVPFNAFRAKAFLTYDDNVCVSVVYNVEGNDVSEEKSTAEEKTDGSGDTTTGAGTRDDDNDNDDDDDDGDGLEETNIDNGGDADLPKLHTDYNQSRDGDGDGDGDDGDGSDSKNPDEQEMIIWSNLASSILEAVDAYRAINAAHSRLAQGRANVKGVLVTDTATKGTGVRRDPRFKRTMRNAYNTLNRRMATLTLRRLRRRASINHDATDQS
ncbi:hypothetical protein PTSG_07022 [Salpingoeca rosetta]|uniref:FERM domain-containing protein n=1 Tax=Salpingoeca rosetta (strain ATCC 50818 / BSB-021) TaxID=946362 RepID=F2UDT9_SALR5|nr:uncharacterized protein PTSG_07022 [Salpingoeca rosetta]EGD74789.1 hypothetical protein PTSG_07022 [Salpingoeca rosetta]|eukprot:XP_004992434.1 hypothetical protein PTSG_07022 [Salpingoeca rosetta]